MNPIEGIKTTDTSGKTPTGETSLMGEEDLDLLLEDQRVLDGLVMTDINLTIEAETHPGGGTRPGGGKPRQREKNLSMRIGIDHACQEVESMPDASAVSARPVNRSENLLWIL